MGKRPSIALVLIALSTGVAHAQPLRPHKRTPPQPFFDWSRLDFDPAEYLDRRTALLKKLTDAGGGVLLIPSAEGTSHGETFRQSDDFLYFTGLELPRSLLAIDAHEGSVTLFVPRTDKRFENPARRNDFPGRLLLRDPAIREKSRIDDVRPMRAFDAYAAKSIGAGRTILLNRDSVSPRSRPPRPIEATEPSERLHDHLLALNRAAKFGNAFFTIAALRMVKSPAEIALMRRACTITCESIRDAAQEVRTGVDERTLEGVLELGFKKRGSQRRAFDSIIKSGPNSLWPWRILAAHYDRRNRAMQAGELVIFDVGCELNHYATDVGRTFPVDGRFRKAQRERLELVTGVADAVIAAARPGLTLTELRDVAYARIPNHERRYMQTGRFFGHHVGLATGDPSVAELPLAPGMVFTVEPWYYNHDEAIAVFVEDMILITEDGCENLSASLPRSPTELESMVSDR